MIHEAAVLAGACERRQGASGAGARGFVFPAGRRHLVISFFSPRMRADMSAALVDTEENWKCRPGNSLRVIPPGDADSTVPDISSTGSVKCRSVMRMTDSRVFFTLLRIFSYSISSSVEPWACLPIFCR